MMPGMAKKQIRILHESTKKNEAMQAMIYKSAIIKLDTLHKNRKTNRGELSEMNERADKKIRKSDKQISKWEKSEYNDRHSSERFQRETNPVRQHRLPEKSPDFL